MWAARAVSGCWHGCVLPYINATSLDAISLTLVALDAHLLLIRHCCVPQMLLLVPWHHWQLVLLNEKLHAD